MRNTIRYQFYPNTRLIRRLVSDIAHDIRLVSDIPHDIRLVSDIPHDIRLVSDIPQRYKHIRK